MATPQKHFALTILGTITHPFQRGLSVKKKCFYRWIHAYLQLHPPSFPLSPSAEMARHSFNDRHPIPFIMWVSLLILLSRCCLELAGSCLQPGHCQMDKHTHTHHMPIFFFLFSLSLSPTSPHTCSPYMMWQIPGHALACPCTLQVTSPILNAGSMARIIAREGTCHMPTSTSFLFLSSHLLPRKNVIYGHRPTLVP